MSVSSLTGTVLRARSGFYTVTTASGTYECQLRGRLKRERQSEDLVVAGDEVTITADGVSNGAAQAVIEAVAAHWPIAPGIEITLEANPNSVEAARFADLAAAARWIIERRA